MTTVLSGSAAETMEIARRAAKRLSKGDIVALNGQMGTGKTTFVQGLAKALGVKDEVTSPTFALINEYTGENCKICHMDAWRIDDLDELFEIGFFEYLNREWIVAVEWSEKLEGAFEETLSVDFFYMPDSRHKIVLEGKGF